MARRPKNDFSISHEEVENAVEAFLNKGGVIKKDNTVQYANCYFQVSTSAISNFDIVGEDIDYED